MLRFTIGLVLVSVLDVNALRIGSVARVQSVRSPAPVAGLFDGIAKAFANEDFDDRNAKGTSWLV